MSEAATHPGARATAPAVQRGRPRLFAAGALLLTTLFLVALSGLGTDEAGLRALVRWTARVSFAVFLPVYTASALVRLGSGSIGPWLLRNRRALGLCFAWAHFLHLLAIGMLALLLGDAFDADGLVLVGGGLAYALLAAMALTSSDRAVRKLGARRWRVLHRAGVHWIWVIFAADWTGLALEQPAYLVAAIAAWAAALLRLAAWLRPRRRGAPSAERPIASRGEAEPAPPGPSAQAGPAGSIELVLDGETRRVDYREGESVLEAARRAGLAPPYSCEQGYCASCIALLEGGRVEMTVNDCLPDDVLEAGWVLTCQSRCVTEGVRIVYPD